MNGQRSHPRLVCWGLVLGGCWLVLGCGDGGPKTYPVSGTVTLDGLPLEQGDIYFYSLDPNISADSGKIKAGHFAFRAKAGAKRVEITASWIVPGKKTPMGGSVKEQGLPSRYNELSTLTCEVLTKGDNRFEFALESKP